MSNKIKVFGMLFGGFILFSFSNDPIYVEKIKEWQIKRISGLKSEEGWLNLAGLFWLNEGVNTIGSDSKNNIRFPENHAADFLGKLILQNGVVTYEASPNAEVTLNNIQIKNSELFPYKGQPIVLTYKTLRWFIIQRGDRYAVRLRDLEGDYLKNFKGIETFPINEKWRLKSRFVPSEGKKLKIVDIIGTSYEVDSPGKLFFIINGKEYSLDATGTKEHLHFVFADASNNHETYGGGRFLDADTPDSEGNIYLDFNKSYNPPCAFTPYATCPIPTKENTLTISIKAGEKYSGEH